MNRPEFKTYRMPRKKPLVYLCGPINGCSDGEAIDWRENAKKLIEDRDWGWVDPMSRDYRGQELSSDEVTAAIVEDDKGDITTCRAVLAYAWKPSVGTSMETLYAWERGIKVALVWDSSDPVSPWFKYHTEVISPSVEHAIGYLDTCLRW